MKKIKNILFMTVFTLIMAVQSINVNAQNLSELQSGIYEIKNDVYHEQEIGMSMARSYLNEDMSLEKKDNKWYYTVTFNGTEYMENYRILIDEEEVSSEIIEENEDEKSIKIKFETPEIIPNLSTQIYVDAMGRDVEFDIIPKEETLNLVQAIEEVKEEVETTSEEKEIKDNKSEIFLGTTIVAVLFFGILGIKKFKR